jgi:hypothetical protein
MENYQLPENFISHRCLKLITKLKNGGLWKFRSAYPRYQCKAGSRIFLVWRTPVGAESLEDVSAVFPNEAALYYFLLGVIRDSWN